MQTAAQLTDQRIKQIFSVGSESQRIEFVRNVQGRLFTLLSLVWEHFANSSEAVQAAFEMVMRRKTIVSETLAIQREVVLRGRYPDLEPSLRELAVLRAQIAAKTLAGPESEGAEEHDKILAEGTWK